MSVKLILRNVKIYGFDPNSYKTFENNGKSTKQYNVPLYISDEDAALIGEYIYGKTSKNEKGENIFYGKSKTPIPVYDQGGQKINTLIFEVFIADVSILIDEFADEKTGENVRYSKCLGIKYISKVEEEKPKIPEKPVKQYDTFDDIFKSEDAIESSSTAKPNLPPAFSDLPWDANGNEVIDPKKNDDLPF